MKYRVTLRWVVQKDPHRGILVDVEVYADDEEHAMFYAYEKLLDDVEVTKIEEVKEETG